MSLKLSIEIVPEPLHYRSLRSVVSGSDWDVIRKKVYKNAGWKCQSCGASNIKCNAHEVWNYDDVKHIQKLIGFVCLCHDCHMVKHLGFAEVSGKFDDAFNHFRAVNGLPVNDAKKLVDDAWKMWETRNNHDWIQDMGYAKEFMRGC